ncbi:hypothetical protein DSM03_104196 [Leeuwenhoekiella aestuarii]|nr:hypothetical protein DSM03_104196 [Leeuwenhoekiella aestuarii]
MNQNCKQLVASAGVNVKNCETTIEIEKASFI